MDTDAIKLIRALGDLQRARVSDDLATVMRDALPLTDLLAFSRVAGIAYTALHPVIHAGIAAGYLAQDSHGALRLTAPGWRLHHWDQEHRRR